MKTKTKMIAMVEIAIVLCSVFLVAIPAIAAEQNQEMQKVSANTITTASEDDYVLGIYGNANEDDTIDMGDVVYIKLAIFGKKPKTELCDAKYDGRINVLDIIQTKLIILGKEKELTIIDDLDEIVTITKPLERIIVAYYTVGQTVRAIGAKDRVVGVADWFLKNPTTYPDLSKKPCVGSGRDMDVEMILELEPDAVILARTYTKGLEEKLKGTGINVVRVIPFYPETLRNNVMLYGYILDEVENARNYFEWHDGYINEIEETVSGISEDERTRVFVDDIWKPSITERRISAHMKTAEQAGGKLITADLPVEQGMVDVEWILEQNPDVIIGCSFAGGYETDDESVYKAEYDEIIGVPGYAKIKAVQDGRVHIIKATFGMGMKTPISTAYMAKWFYPELFEDLDPEAIHQEFMDTFCPGVDLDVSEHGVFVYPPLK